MVDKNTDFFKIEDHFKEKEHIPSIPIFENRLQNSPKFTIAIPTYKRARYLKEALESAINQDTNVPYEIIVVDNNPDHEDETERIMKTYLSIPNLSYYKNCENLGMAGNWNRCIELARAEWVVILHDDDMILSEYLKTVIPCLKEDIDELHIPMTDFKDGEDLPPISNPDKTVMKKVYVSDHFLFPVCSPSGSVFKNSNIMKLGGFINDAVAPDLTFVRFVNYSNVYILNKSLVYYRKGINESTKLDAMEKMCKLYHNVRPEIWNKIGIPSILSRIALPYADVLFERGFQKTWNQNFRFSENKKYSRIKIFISKIIFNTISWSLKLKNKIIRSYIIISNE